MSMPPNNYLAKVKKVENEIDNLEANIDQLVTERVMAVASEISGVPVGVLRNMLQARSTCYCKCMALRNIAEGNDGL
jgi:hypothetical protein